MNCGPIGVPIESPSQDSRLASTGVCWPANVICRAFLEQRLSCMLETVRACRFARPSPAAQLVEPTSPLSSRAAGRAAASAWPVLHWSCQAAKLVRHCRTLPSGLACSPQHVAWSEIDLHFAARPSTRSHPRYGIWQGATESGALKVTRGAPRVRRCRRHCPARRTAAGASPQRCWVEPRPCQGGSGWLHPPPVPRPLQSGHGRSRAPAAAVQQPQPLALRHRGQWKRACCECCGRDSFTPALLPPL
jgi:hypothetical protein